MAQVNTDDEERRSAAADQNHYRGVALADESTDILPGLATFAVLIAAVLIGLLSTQSDFEFISGSDDAAEEEVAADPGDAPAEPIEEVEAALPDLPAIEAGLPVAGLALGSEGNIVTVTGTVPDEDTRNAVIAYVSDQPNVDAVNDELVIEALPAAAVQASAAQASIVLSGTVPDEATRAALVERAVAVYSEAQVDDQLVVDAGVTPPVSVTLTGAVTDPVLFQQVVGAFEGVDGVSISSDSTFVLEESSEVEASLNALEPIQFASGSALIEPASEAILDQAAAFLTENPDLVIEIGGHTDSVGDAAGNETLSQARAEAVQTALVERGVTNELTPVGFGERRLKEDPDDTPEAQQANRRIEFRIL